MENTLKVLGGAAIAAAVVLFIGILGTLVGMLSGWIVGLFFTDLIIGFIDRFGVNTVGLEVWHVGGALGFIGAFFRTATVAK